MQKNSLKLAAVINLVTSKESSIWDGV